MNTVIEQSAIEALIFSFRDAFNAADISKVVSSYGQEATLMPNNAPSAKGSQPIKATYESLFKAFNIHIEYVIEDVIVSGEYGFAKTKSKVETVVNASGESVLLDNKELFVLQKEGGQWKIAYYIFNNTAKN